MIRSIQALKGLAFLLIFVSHCSFFSSRFGFFGGVGVSIFVILSGFLISINLNAYESQINYAKRIYKRIKKIYPLHIVTTIVMLIALTLLKSDNDIVIKLIANIFLIKGFVPYEEIYFSLNSVSWYLSVFLLFTIMERPLQLFAKKIAIKKEKIILFSFVVVLIEIAWTIFCSNFFWAHWGVYINPFFRMIDYLCGAVLGNFIIEKKRELDISANWLFLIVLFCSCCIGISVLVVPGSSLANWFMTTIWIIPSMALIVIFYYMRSKQSILFQNKYLVCLGNMGLEVFLIHKIIIFFWQFFVPNGGIFLRVFGVFICLITTIAIAQLYRIITINIKQRR